MVWGERDRLRLVFFNLMENAVKFNDSGGTVAVTAREEAADVEVRITNSHGMIPPGHVEGLLQPFTQGDMGTVAQRGSRPGSGGGPRSSTPTGALHLGGRDRHHGASDCRWRVTQHDMPAATKTDTDTRKVNR
jgi:hypothetical protein